MFEHIFLCGARENPEALEMEISSVQKLCIHVSGVIVKEFQLLMNRM